MFTKFPAFEKLYSTSFRIEKHRINRCSCVFFFPHPCPHSTSGCDPRIADNTFEEEGREKYSRLALSSGAPVIANKAERVGGNVAAYRSGPALARYTDDTANNRARGRGTNNGAEQCIYFNNRTIRRGRLSVTLRTRHRPFTLSRSRANHSK